MTLDGTLNVFDASYTANVAVGNNPLIAGTDAPSRDAVVAGNVWPFNLRASGTRRRPGDGIEAGAAVPVGAGRGGGGPRAVGLDQQVVGELIPGRDAAPGTRVQVTGTLAAR
ncbi:MAG: hypothetical protein IPL76_03235 [Gemmatimonadetes bacterium]|nr:hypothetical protein [Gemmatimonadota bacterium]